MTGSTLTSTHTERLQLAVDSTGRYLPVAKDCYRSRRSFGRIYLDTGWLCTPPKNTVHSYVGGTLVYQRGCPFVFFLDCCIYRSSDLIDAEAGRFLARWIVDEGLQKLADFITAISVGYTFLVLQS
jgi:hypothetical protein